MVNKERYLLLDGLRGVAALMVLCYHLFEAVAFAAGAKEQQMFHGFLAVDFFLILSGFVMGQAYDDGWGLRFGLGGFVRRRLIRLHPMVVAGVAVGLAVFLFQGRLRWDGSTASWSSVIVSTVLSLLLLPQCSSLDVRGNTELFPLNGPHWSLFFEYIGSLLYALLLRKMSTRALKMWVAASSAALLASGFVGGDWNIAYGWSSQPFNMLGGLVRMSFAYPAGLLLARLYREKKPSRLSSGIFWACSAVLLLVLWTPGFSGMVADGRIGAARVIFEAVSVCLVFPAIIWFGARGVSPASSQVGILTFLGELSYPLYAIHYPFIYLYISWINEDVHPFGQALWCTPVALAVICVTLAVLFLYLYDKPVRRKLSESVWM